MLILLSCYLKLIQMDWDSLIFPAPRNRVNIGNLEGKILWIPNQEYLKSEDKKRSLKENGLRSSASLRIFEPNTQIANSITTKLSKNQLSRLSLNVKQLDFSKRKENEREKEINRSSSFQAFNNTISRRLESCNANDSLIAEGTINTSNLLHDILCEYQVSTNEFPSKEKFKSTANKPLNFQSYRPRRKEVTKSNYAQVQRSIVNPSKNNTMHSNRDVNDEYNLKRIRSKKDNQYNSLGIEGKPNKARESCIPQLKPLRSSVQSNSEVSFSRVFEIGNGVDIIPVLNGNRKSTGKMPTFGSRPVVITSNYTSSKQFESNPSTLIGVGCPSRPILSSSTPQKPKKESINIHESYKFDYLNCPSEIEVVNESELCDPNISDEEDPGICNKRSDQNKGLAWKQPKFLAQKYQGQYQNALASDRDSQLERYMKSSLGNGMCIPCIYIKANPITSNTSQKFKNDCLLIYFHANGEDLHDVQLLCDTFSRFLGINVLGVEYPGYSIYKGESSEQAIYNDAEQILQFARCNLDFKLETIVVVGRSLGTGPAIHLASKFSIGGLLLISAFTSIKAVAKNLVGSIGQYFIKERFQNLVMSDRIKCPTLLIHGALDALVPPNHSKLLFNRIITISELFIADDMGHDISNFFEQILSPFYRFLKRIKFAAGV